MRYVSKCRLPGLIVLALSVVACAFNGGKNSWNYDGSGPAELIATEIYLPKQLVDEEGLLLPYQAQPNPYEELTGRIDRSIIDRYIQARRAFQKGDYVQAEEMLAALMAEAPDLSGPTVMRGDIALATDNLPQAVEFYMAAIRTNPINFNAYLRLAKAQRMRGHFIHAQNTYARALQRWPDGAELHLNLGVLYDIYLNKPLQAQAHMEAYQLLRGDNSGEVVAWLDEIRQRTGVQSVLRTAAGAVPPSRGQTDSRQVAVSASGEKE